MVAYVIRRLFSGLIMLLMVTLVTFVLFFAAGKDPAK
ncbi:MAG: ABC transporter permease, partial [Dermacoccus nishinomiyaensis]